MGYVKNKGWETKFPHNLALPLQWRIGQEKHSQQEGLLPVLPLAFTSVLARFKSLKNLLK